MNIRVFVYGTLKKGQPNYHVLSETAGSYKFVNSGRTSNCFPLMITSKFNIPVILAKNGEGHRIYGEVYEVDEEKLVILDELEAYPKLYDRRLEKIEIIDGSIIEAWIYMLREWRNDIYAVSSPLMDSYCSKGAHGRPYVDRYARAIQMISDEGFDLYGEFRGESNQETRLMTIQKAEHDLNL